MSFPLGLTAYLKTNARKWISSTWSLLLFFLCCACALLLSPVRASILLLTTLFPGGTIIRVLAVKVKPILYHHLKWLVQTSPLDSLYLEKKSELRRFYRNDLAISTFQFWLLYLYPSLRLWAQTPYKTLQCGFICDYTVPESHREAHLQESSLVVITHWCYVSIFYIIK